MKLFPIHISNFKIDGGAMFGVVPKMLWERKLKADENNLCNWSLRSLLVKTGDHLILIDTGYGDKQSEKYFSHVYLNGGDGLEGAIKKAGFTLDEITDVVHTHLHADHCGGGVKRKQDGSVYELVFKNATYWIGKDQWEWAMNPNPQEGSSFLEENLLPISESGRLQFIDEEGELFPDFHVRLYYGHTKGQVVPIINYHGKKIVFAADLIPSAHHVPLLWNMAYDIEPMKTLEEKDNFLQEALKENYTLFFQHDVDSECCSLELGAKGVVVKDTFKLEAFL